MPRPAVHLSCSLPPHGTTLHVSQDQGSSGFVQPPVTSFHHITLQLGCASLAAGYCFSLGAELDDRSAPAESVAGFSASPFHTVHLSSGASSIQSHGFITVDVSTGPGVVYNGDMPRPPQRSSLDFFCRGTSCLGSHRRDPPRATHHSSS